MTPPKKDIVERLRRMHEEAIRSGNPLFASIFGDAADEIERLREQVILLQEKLIANRDRPKEPAEKSDAQRSIDEYVRDFKKGFESDYRARIRKRYSQK